LVRPRAFEDARQVSNALCRPVRVGGDSGSQLFVDISHCDGTIALTGDPAAASEVLQALLGELAVYHRDLTLAVLGTRQAGSVSAQLMQHSGMLAARIGPAAPGNDSPVRAAAARRQITGVVAVPGDVPVEESFEVARLCALRGSTWLALVVGDVPGAHWRWNVDRAGHMRLPAIGRTVVASR
jgi:ubiquinone biosynthesis protein UbiJ